MQLLDNILIYDSEDLPKEIDFHRDWEVIVESIKAVSPKILYVLQEGIYGNEARRFRLQVSEELTEQEISEVLATWDSYAPLVGYKHGKVKELSNLVRQKRMELLSDERLHNALGGVYDIETCVNPPITKAQAIEFIESHRALYYATKSLIEIAETEEEVDTIIQNIVWPTL